jgi:hypothetical protein
VGEILVGDYLAGVGLAGRLRVISGASLPPPAVVTLGPGFAPSGSPPQLSAGIPVLGTTWALSVNGAPSSAPGYLVAAPAPENPLVVAPQITIYPDLLQASEWLLVPLLTAGGGFWSALVPIPFDHNLAGVGFVLQTWFPSPAGLLGGSFSNGLRTTFGY